MRVLMFLLVAVCLHGCAAMGITRTALYLPENAGTLTVEQKASGEFGDVEIHPIVTLHTDDRVYNQELPVNTEGNAKINVYAYPGNEAHGLLVVLDYEPGEVLIDVKAGEFTGLCHAAGKTFSAPLATDVGFAEFHRVYSDQKKSHLERVDYMNKPALDISAWLSEGKAYLGRFEGSQFVTAGEAAEDPAAIKARPDHQSSRQ